VQDQRGGSSSLSVNALLACARNQAAHWLRHKNPFIDHTHQPLCDTAVLTFEVGFSDVVGMDFRCVCCRDTRVRRVWHDTHHGHMCARQQL
jgi:hypothetical protein